jgi:hypothetical protein
MNKNGNNQFKRAFRDAKEINITDARNTAGLAFPDEPQSTTIIQDLTGKRYVQILPNRRQMDSDSRQLKAFPGYRLIDTDTSSSSSSSTSSTTLAPSDGLVDSDLNEDVTDFLKLLNDVGSRISYYTDPVNANDFASTREIVTDTLGMDSISSNIIRGVEDMKSFFYEFGKKIAPPGVNPYRNNDCMQLLKHHENKEHNHHHNKNININSSPKDVEYAKGPYNPADLNTYMNCLETLSRKSTMADTTTSYDDFNLKVFQSIIVKTKVSKFMDSEIDELGVTRPLPYYNPLHLMIEILKIDTKLFNILYLLNLHNTSRSPITGAYYGKERTKINENGFPVLSDSVTSTDIHNATVQMLDLINCILRLITFIDLDAYNKIITDYFSITSVGVVQPADDVPIIIDDSAAYNNYTASGSSENIPTFLYGQLLSFCDAARQAINEIILATFPNSPLYNPSKVANIAFNCTYGLLAVAQLIEGLLKSRCFALVMSMLFPSGTFHSDPILLEARGIPEWGERFRFNRLNDDDMQSITRMAIDGIPLDMTKIVPPKSIPHYLPEDDPIYINKAIFCTLITALCGISRFLWNSNSPCLTLCDFTDDGAFDPDVPYPAPSPRPTTTMPPFNSCCELRKFMDDDSDLNSMRDLLDDDNFDESSRKRISTKLDSVPFPNRASRDSSARIITNNISPPQEVDNQPDPQDLFSIKPMITYLQDNTYASVLTSNNKVFTFFQVYVAAFACHDRLTFNDRVSKSRAITQPTAINKGLYSLLSRGVPF